MTQSFCCPKPRFTPSQWKKDTYDGLLRYSVRGRCSVDHVLGLLGTHLSRTEVVRETFLGEVMLEVGHEERGKRLF